MKLAELEPKLYRDSRTPESEETSFANAGAIEFKCPNCGAHTVTVPLAPLHGGGWDRFGDTFETLTLRPSIQIHHDCKWHGFVTNGEVTTC